MKIDKLEILLSHRLVTAKNLLLIKEKSNVEKVGGTFLTKKYLDRNQNWMQ